MHHKVAKMLSMRWDRIFVPGRMVLPVVLSLRDVTRAHYWTADDLQGPVKSPLEAYKRWEFVTIAVVFMIYASRRQHSPLSSNALGCGPAEKQSNMQELDAGGAHTRQTLSFDSIFASSQLCRQEPTCDDFAPQTERR